MATTYQWKGAGYGVPQIGPAATFKKTIDIPKLVAEGAKAGLATTAAPNTGVALPSTGFGVVDILEVFWVPKGMAITQVGMYVIVGEGATCTIDVGVQSATETSGLAKDVDGWGVFNIETALVFDSTDDNDGFGSDNFPAGELYVTNGSIDIEFNNASTETAVFEIFAIGFWIGDLTNPANY